MTAVNRFLALATSPSRHTPPRALSPAARPQVAAVDVVAAAGALFVAALRLALWPRRRPLKASRVCVYRIGNVGDTVCALPVIHAVRRAYPDARLTLLTSPGDASLPGARELLESVDWIDEILVYEPAKLPSLRDRFAFARTLRARQFDVWIEVPNDRSAFRTILRNIALARIAGVGWGGGWRLRTVPLFERAQSAVRHFPNEVEALLETGRRLGLPVDPVTFALPIREAHTAAARRLLAKAGLAGRPLVAIAPGAKRPMNRWPAERFAAVARRLVQRGFCVVAVGGASDRARCDEVLGGLEGHVLNAAGRASLLESAALLRECRVLACNDSGVQHLAAAVGVPCVSLFSAREMRGKWHPYGFQHVVIEKWIECHTCLLEVCPHDDACIKGIRVAEVNAALDAFSESFTSSCGTGVACADTHA